MSRSLKSYTTLEDPVGRDATEPNDIGQDDSKIE